MQATAVRTEQKQKGLKKCVKIEELYSFNNSCHTTTLYFPRYHLLSRMIHSEMIKKLIWLSLSVNKLI